MEKRFLHFYFLLSLLFVDPKAALPDGSSFPFKSRPGLRELYPRITLLLLSVCHNTHIFPLPVLLPVALRHFCLLLLILLVLFEPDTILGQSLEGVHGTQILETG